MEFFCGAVPWPNAAWLEMTFLSLGAVADYPFGKMIV